MLTRNQGRLQHDVCVVYVHVLVAGFAIVPCSLHVSYKHGGCCAHCTDQYTRYEYNIYTINSGTATTLYQVSAQRHGASSGLS